VFPTTKTGYFSEHSLSGVIIEIELFTARYELNPETQFRLNSILEGSKETKFVTVTESSTPSSTQIIKNTMAKGSAARKPHDMVS
jgi:hypothetical protein